MIREALPYAVTVLVLFAGLMLTAEVSPTPAVLGVGVFASVLLAAVAGVAAAQLAWGPTE